MSNKLQFSVVGKDRRLMFCSEALENEGYKSEFCTDEIYISNNSDYYVFGIPFKKNMLPSDIRVLAPNSCVFGGMITPDTEEVLKNNGFRVIDYAKSEFFRSENALLTAEAAMTVYIGSVGEGFKGSEVLITGFGRIGKALARLLTSHGASVTVSARKYSDIERISEYGCYPMETLGINGAYDVIFNTVPAWIFTRDVLDRTQTKTYVELASPPYGIESYMDWGDKTKVILASGLPGKVLPISAGRIIKEAIIMQLNNDTD